MIQRYKKNHEVFMERMSEKILKIATRTYLKPWLKGLKALTHRV